ncbi:MAG: CDP-glycerol glycerophosphotransferase family protein, partial [Methanococcaceae archaeon]
MEVILVFRRLTDNEMDDVQLARANGTEIFVMPGLLTESISYNSVLPFLFIPEALIKEASADLIRAIKELGDKDIDSSSLSELLTIDRVPLWHYQRFRVFFMLRNEWIIRRCIEQYKKDYSLLKVYTPFSFSILEDLHGVSVIAGQKSAKKRLKLNFKVLINYVIFFKLRIVISMLRRVPVNDKHNVIIDRSLRQVCRNIHTLETKKDNFNLYPLFDANPEGQLIISEVETPKLYSTVPFKLWKHFFNGEGRNERTVYGEWILFKGILSLNLRKHYTTLKGQLRQVNSKLNIDNTQQKLSDYIGIVAINSKENKFNSKPISFTNNEKRILRTFFSLNKSSNFYLLKHLCYYNFFSKCAFKTICAIDENSPATRSILDAARKCSIKTIGIQHGNIGDSHPAYLYTQKDQERNVMTDLTLTWGDYFTDFLISNANYPSDSVKTVGQMRSDLIPTMKAIAHEYRKKLTDSPFLVIFASQPIPDVDFRHKVAYDVFKSFSNLTNAKLIVKLHPAERFDVDYYRSISEEAGYNNPDIRYDIDLYELLAAADLVITCFSTVGSEAVYFERPLIVYDPFREDLLKYVSEGVAFQAVDQQSLQLLLEEIQTGQLSIDLNNYNEFIR